MTVLHRNVTVGLAIFTLFSIINQAPATAAAQSGGTVMVAKIDGKLSTKNAKVGDTVAAKLLQSWKLSDGTEIPKGSKITGKVSIIKSKKDGGGNSALSFRLDEIDVKGSAPIPIHGMVVAIGPSLAPKDGLGANSDMGRNAGPGPQTDMSVPGASQGSRSGKKADPDAGLGGPNGKDENDIPMGSTMPGVSLGHNPDVDWTTILSGAHTEIDLDSDVLIKVQLK